MSRLPTGTIETPTSSTEISTGCPGENLAARAILEGIRTARLLPHIWSFSAADFAIGILQSIYQSSLYSSTEGANGAIDSRGASAPAPHWRTRDRSRARGDSCGSRLRDRP